MRDARHPSLPRATRSALPRRLAAASVAVAAALACAPATTLARANQGEAYAPGRILIKTRAGMPDAALAGLLKANGAGQSRRIGKSDLHVVSLPKGLEKAMIKRLQANPHVEFAELDQLVPLNSSNDPYFGSQWHLPKIGASTAWANTTGSGVTIAILDTGVDGSHTDLKDRMVAGYNFYDNNTDTRDVHGHGTAVAGTAAATLNNGTGVASVAGAAKIMPLRISDPNGYAYWSTVANALTWAADKGARVANVSYGVSGSSTVQSAANYMKSKGGLVVVSAGNNGKDEGLAASDTMITVSATNRGDGVRS